MNPNYEPAERWAGVNTMSTRPALVTPDEIAERLQQPADSEPVLRETERENLARHVEFQQRITERINQRKIDEYITLRAREEATQQRKKELAAKAKAEAGSIAFVKDGASFLLDVPPTAPSVWGAGDDVLWARGEALVICGGQGVGKTTLAGQLLAGCLGVLPDVLGFPVAVARRRVLYLAMDRPQQAARNLARVFRGADRDLLSEKLRVWTGPPPADFAAAPETMLEMCLQHDADVVFVDSLKDAAMGLSGEEGGGGYNRARQKCIQNGIEVVELHHQRKSGENGAKPKTINDVYGSTFITSGAGSVIVLFGDPGDPMVEFIHLKQPINVVGPFNIVHDQFTGISRVVYDDDKDLVARARRCSTTGLSVKEAAQILTGSDTPDRGKVEKARRELQKLERKGLLTMRSADAGMGRGREDRWFAAASKADAARVDGLEECGRCNFDPSSREHTILCLHEGRPAAEVGRLFGETPETIEALREMNAQCS